MPKRVCAVLVLSGLVAAGSASAATSPHAQARILLTKCLTALHELPVAKVKSKTAAVPRAVRARHLVTTCSIVLPMQPLVTAHQQDKALQDAYHAGIALNLAVTDYAVYVVGVTFGHQKLALLHRSQREAAAAEHAAHVALTELG